MSTWQPWLDALLHNGLIPTMDWSKDAALCACFCLAILLVPVLGFGQISTQQSEVLYQSFTTEQVFDVMLPGYSR
jgi:hypothetical protein